LQSWPRGTTTSIFETLTDNCGAAFTEFTDERVDARDRGVA